MTDASETVDPGIAGEAVKPIEESAATEPAEPAELTEPAEPVEPAEPLEPLEPAPAIESRFLFVDVASRRANQLRRGARIRLQASEGHHVPHKLERAAMEEVGQQLIHYQVPDLPESTASKS
jgi:DNA-directed RNA polymerase subunit K/omega